MQQLSGQDASFIYSERPHAPTHITSISIYDPSTAPGGSVTFKGILAHLEARLHLARAFRQKVVRVPADLDHPYWVEDAEFDLEYHVRHIALPKPGDWRQFCIQAARLHARPLDLLEAAVGAVRHRGPRQGRRRSEGWLRLRAEDPPRRGRRQVGRRDDHRHPLADAGRASIRRHRTSRGVPSPTRRRSSSTAGP